MEELEQQLKEQSEQFSKAMEQLSEELNAFIVFN